MMTRRFGAALALSVAVGGGAAHAQDVPTWLTEAKAREARLPPPVEVASEDGWLRTRLPGAVRHKIVLEEGSYSLAISLDGGVTVSCEVLPEARDLASLLARTAEISFGEIQKINGTLEARLVESAGAGAVGPHPYLSLQWLYRAEQKGEKRVGALKQYVADLETAVVYCAHDELGYDKTFEAVAQALTANLRTGGQQPPPAHYREVMVMHLDGAPVGVASTTLIKDEDGDTRVRTRSAMLVQRVPGQLTSQDVSDVQWVRPDGSLINASQAKASDGELNEQMELQYQEGQGWRASGTIDGKPIESRLAAAPSSYISLAQARRQLMTRPEPVGASTEATTWSSLDLTRLLTSRATVLAPAGAGRFAVREEIGGMAIEAVLDQQTGTMVSARMPLGPRTLSFERIFQQGAF